MKVQPKLAGRSRLPGPQPTADSNQTQSSREPMEASNWQVAAGMAALVVVVLCGLWLFADILSKVAG